VQLRVRYRLPVLDRQAGWRRVAHRVRKRLQGRGPAARRRFFRQAARFTPYVSVQAKELTFFVSTQDRLGRGLFARRWREDMGHLENAVEALEDHGLSPAGSTLIDIGANIGTTTVSAIRRHGFARAVALEPEPRNFGLLRLNLLANGVDSSVTAIEVGASDRVGRVDFVRSRTSSGEHALAQFVPADRLHHIISVEAATIDSLVREGMIDPAKIGLVWMDVEGAEALVLAGASTLLERRVPIAAAIRPTKPGWQVTKEALARHLAVYTTVVHLRSGQLRTSVELARLLESLKRTEDLLFFQG
jgi:FkbM family methyltransferase